MTNIIANMVCHGVMVFIDDILVDSKTWEEHMEKLEEVLRRMKENNLQAKVAKCHFANTHHNLCPLLTTMEWFESTMHIWCFHLVVTPLVSIRQPWCVFQHQVCVVEHLVHVLWMW